MMMKPEEAILHVTGMPLMRIMKLDQAVSEFSPEFESSSRCLSLGWNPSNGQRKTLTDLIPHGQRSRSRLDTSKNTEPRLRLAKSISPPWSGRSTPIKCDSG